MAEKMKKRIVVGATGASGLPLLVKCLEIIREDPDFESYLIMSSSAELTLRQETGIHSGYADNLILRAADVTIKEQRTLVLAARETPLSGIHLRNLYELSMLPGVRIIPPMMTFYHKPESIDDMVYHIAAKLLEPFGIEAKEYRRWNGL